jgi:hypothetical protein
MVSSLVTDRLQHTEIGDDEHRGRGPRNPKPRTVARAGPETDGVMKSRRSTKVRGFCRTTRSPPGRGGDLGRATGAGQRTLGFA